MDERILNYMKIGIITLPLRTNYGGILQAYALQKVLLQLGHDVTLIEKKRLFKIPYWKRPYVYVKRIVKSILGKKTPIFLEKKLATDIPIIEQHTRKFIHNNIHRICYKDYKCIRPNEYNAFIVGSDQIWRPKYFGVNNITNAYLGFAKDWNIKRIAYAVSFGTSDWEYTSRQTTECKKLIDLFNAVSVREYSGIELCKKNFSISAEHVLDPTLLLAKDDYIHLINNLTPPHKGEVFCYFLDETPQKRLISQNIIEYNKLTTFSVKSIPQEINNSIQLKICPPIEEWLKCFYDASLVITDSFHACVFSIIFQKPFIAIGNQERGMARFQSLMKLFGTEDRLITTYDTKLTFKEIDWEKINLTLRLYRQKSINFLKSALNK